MKKAGEVCTVKWPLKSGVATKQIGIVASGGSNIDATLEQRRRRRRSKRQVLRDATRAHESFIQSVVVGAIKTLMLVRRWRQRAVFYAIDSSSLQWPTPSVSLSLSGSLPTTSLYRFIRIHGLVSSLRHSSLNYHHESKFNTILHSNKLWHSNFNWSST